MRNNKNEFNLWGDWNVCTFELLWLFFGKEVVFSKTYPSFLTLKEGSTSHLGLLQWSLHPLRFPRQRGTETSGRKRETALLGAQNRYALRLAGHQSPRQILCGMGPPYYNLLLVCAMLCGMGPPGNSSLQFTVNSLLFTIDFVVICRFLVIFLVVSKKKRNFAAELNV